MKQTLLYRGLLFNATGLLLTFIFTRVLPPEIAMLTFFAGVCLTSFGLIDVSVFLWQSRREIAAYHKRRMRNANRGIVWIWAVALAGICVYAISFYVLVYPTLELIGVVEGMTSWDADAAFTLNLVRTVLNWHPILFIIGLLIWAFVNSQRREDVTYPMY